MREIGGPIASRAFVALVDSREPIGLSSGARERIVAARRVVDRHADGDTPIYGLNTGLGGNLGHRVAPTDMAAFQVQLLRGRAVGVGEPLPARVGRAALLARLVGVCRGTAGASLPVVEQMLAMHNAGLSPVIPTYGSIGAGDLALGAHLGLALIGEGELWVDGERRAAGAALAAAGLAPVILQPKDALVLANHSAVSVALAATALIRAERLVSLARGTATLAGEGYAMNLSIFDAAVNALRPSAGQARAAAWFRRAFDGSWLGAAAPRAIQDALSFRTLAPLFGVVTTALERLAQAVDAELDAGADNPSVLLAADPPAMLSTPNFHTPDIALALDALAQALVQAANASAQRIIKLMMPSLSGLPKYLSPIGGSSAGLVPMQKTVAALLGEIQRHAAPVTLSALPVSEMVEDVAPHTPLAARKLDEQLEALRLLIGIEALVAAQAIDLRRPPALGMVAAALHARIRDTVPMLGEDRPTGQDVEPLLRALESSEVPALLARLDGSVHP